jgi:PEP-CTERM motif-containing protein
LVKFLNGIVFVAGMAVANAASIPGLFNTGVDDSNALLPGGANDTHWTVTYNAGSTTAPAVADDVIFGGCCGLAPWMTNGPNSKWISIANAEFVPSGIVDYDIMFSLNGFDPASASITGGMAADGGVLDVLINGVSTVQSTGFNTWDHFTSFAVNSGFQSGVNVLRFVVNHEDGDFDAFRAELGGTANVSANAPEPASLILMGVGLTFAGVLKKRR